jgi:hypothetical protein
VRRPAAFRGAFKRSPDLPGDSGKRHYRSKLFAVRFFKIFTSFKTHHIPLLKLPAWMRGGLAWATARRFSRLRR